MSSNSSPTARRDRRAAPCGANRSGDAGAAAARRRLEALPDGAFVVEDGARGSCSATTAAWTPAGYTERAAGARGGPRAVTPPSLVENLRRAGSRSCRCCTRRRALASGDGAQPAHTFITVYGRAARARGARGRDPRRSTRSCSRRTRRPRRRTRSCGARPSAACRSRASRRARHPALAHGRHDQGVVADVRALGLAPLGEVGRSAARRAADGARPRRGHESGERGMVLRTATAAGLDGVVLPRRGRADLGPLVIKASAGSCSARRSCARRRSSRRSRSLNRRRLDARRPGGSRAALDLRRDVRRSQSRSSSAASPGA